MYFFQGHHAPNSVHNYDPTLHRLEYYNGVLLYPLPHHKKMMSLLNSLTSITSKKISTRLE